MENHYRVPPSWMDPPTQQGSPTFQDGTDEKLQILGTSMTEPDCDDGWCGLQQAVDTSGPIEYGTVLSGNGRYRISAPLAPSVVTEFSRYEQQQRQQYRQEDKEL